jgi:protein gp37
MSDLFHKDVPLAFIQQGFDVMRRAHWHRFQVLTKRGAALDLADRPDDVRLRISGLGVTFDS